MTEPDTSPISRSRRIVFTLVTLVVGLVIALALLEIGLRIAGFSDLDFYQADETLGYRLTPGMSGWYTREGRSWVEINRDGFRDVEHPTAKPDNVSRVAVIGDSYVEALQVEHDQMFTNYIGDVAANCDAMQGKRVEVMTFGVSGYGTAQELLMLRQSVWKYSPDLVMLVVTTNNDISDNLRAFKQAPIPYFEVKDGGLQLDDSFRQDRKFIVRNAWYSRLGAWLRNRLRFVQAIGAAQRALKYRWSEWRDKKADASPQAVADAESNPAFEAGIDVQVYRPPADDNWRAAWDVTERLIQQMDAEVKDHGARFSVLIATNGVQVLPDKKVRDDFAKKLGVDDLYYPNRRIAAFCDANTIPVVDLAPEFADYVAKTGTVLHGFEGNIGYGHWNQAGHKLAGEIISSRVCSLTK